MTVLQKIVKLIKNEIGVRFISYSEFECALGD